MDLANELIHTDPPCKACEVLKSQPPKSDYRPVLDFIDQLRARGVLQFSGLGLDLTLDPHFSPVEIPRTEEPTVPDTVNIEGIEMDKKLAEDLFGPGHK